jgi:hypothetical protein
MKNGTQITPTTKNIFFLCPMTGLNSYCWRKKKNPPKIVRVYKMCSNLRKGYIIRIFESLEMSWKNLSEGFGTTILKCIWLHAHRKLAPALADAEAGDVAKADLTMNVWFWTARGLGHLLPWLSRVQNLHSFRRETGQTSSSAWLSCKC